MRSGSAGLGVADPRGSATGPRYLIPKEVYNVFSKPMGRSLKGAYKPCYKPMLTGDRN